MLAAARDDEDQAAEVFSPRLRVLVVDDEPDIVTTLCALLRHEGYEARGHPSAEAAIEVLREFVPDVVISDIHMPGTRNGLDLAESAQSLVPPLPVILVTGYAQELERARNVRVRVLSKPFDIALLDAMLQTIRREREEHAPAAGKAS